MLFKPSFFIQPKHNLCKSSFCFHLQSAQSHFYAESVVIQVTLVAISATLAAYCCKVVNCCAPAPKMVSYHQTIVT